MAKAKFIEVEISGEIVRLSPEDVAEIARLGEVFHNHHIEYDPPAYSPIWVIPYYHEPRPYWAEPVITWASPNTCTITSTGGVLNG